MPARPDERLAWQVIGDEGVVLDLERMRAFGLNRSAMVLWELLGKTDEAGLAAALAGRYGLAAEDARRDVEAFLGELRRRRLLREEAG